MSSGVDVSELPLRDIHLPGDVGWWPPAVGWWILAAVAVGMLAFAAYRHARRYRERAAVKAIRRVLTRLEAGESPAACVQQISAVLRRFVMSVHAPDERVAGLTGSRWLEYLDSRWDRTAFSAGPGRELIVAPYAPPERVSTESVRTLAALCLDWVGAQRRRR